MNTRRLPPLQAKGRRSLTPRNPHRSTASSPVIVPVPEMVITGFTPVSNSSNHANTSSINGRIGIQDLNQDLVTEYLDQNPEFLDHYVNTKVTLDQIDRWQLKKLRPPSRYSTRPTHQYGDFLTVAINGDNHNENKVCPSKWKARIHSSKGRVLQELAKEVHQPNGKIVILHELAGCVCAAINADGYNLYLVDEGKTDISHVPNSNSSSKSIPTSNRGKIRLGTTVAAHVAYTQESVRIKDLQGDSRFPEGLGHGNNKAQTVLAQPLQDGRGSVLGVVEFYRNYKYSQFTEEEEEGAERILAWGGLVLFYAEVHSSMLKQRKLNEFLLAVTKSVFQDIISMDTVIMKIMNFAQKLVNADRASLFLVDHHRQELFARIFDVGSSMTVSPIESQQKEIRLHVPSCQQNYAKTLVNADRASLFMLDHRTKELFSRIFDTGTSEETAPQKEIRFPMDKGVAGHVATTGEILNIPDAYKDDRFNRDVDLQTGYRTKSILCMPIYIRGSIIGVVQMVNKLSGPFTRGDEEAFETFAIYCGLALHHAKLYEKIRRSEQKYRVALDVLSYHNQCSDDEIKVLRTATIPNDMQSITDYEYSPWAISTDEKPVYVLHMFKDLFTSMRYEVDDLIRFTLTVKKNYRNVPYHNWVHAFSVAHSMYTVVKTAGQMFTPLESLSLFVACLCHDLDHRGKTNAFMVKSESPLAAIYSTSTMEHHHFNHTVTILQHDGHNIFRHLSSEEYKKVLGDIKHCILATDLALFFGNKAKLKSIVENQQFSWEDPESRHVLMTVSMPACDLCAMYKPWDIQLNLVNVIMEEFWLQGDEERQKGMTPIPMMDRNRQHELPQLEVGFIKGICLPCYELLAEVLPETGPMVVGTVANLKKWQELADNNANEEKLQEEASTKTKTKSKGDNAS